MNKILVINNQYLARFGNQVHDVRGVLAPSAADQNVNNNHLVLIDLTQTNNKKLMMNITLQSAIKQYCKPYSIHPQEHPQYSLIHAKMLVNIPEKLSKTMKHQQLPKPKLPTANLFLILVKLQESCSHAIF